MNNFVFGADPLLYNPVVPKTPTQDPPIDSVKSQLDALAQQYYQQTQQGYTQPTPRDLLGEVDDMIKNSDKDVLTELAGNQEFNDLNTYIQTLIQEEIMKVVKWKINANEEAQRKLERIKTIIADTRKAKTDEDKKTLSDLNDYIKNYSDLTFNEYKKLKGGS